MLVIAKNAQHKRDLGRTGEEKAVAFLKKKGYFIKERNFRYKNDEVDVIAWDEENGELVFVEVKTRAEETILGDPSQAVDRRKLRAQARIANYYIQTQKIASDYRFDIVTVMGEQIEHYENVSWLFE